VMWDVAMKMFNRMVSLMLVVAGVACVVYGTCFHTVNVSANSEGDVPVTMTIVRSEPALTQEASVSGVELDKATGEIKQTYTGQSPEACAT